MRAVGAAVAAGERPLFGAVVVVGVAVLREGSEIVLFLYGIAASGRRLGRRRCGRRRARLGRRESALSALMYFGLLAIPAQRLFASPPG